MNFGKINRLRIFLINLLVIICSAAFAIVVHAVVPAPVDVGKLDGFLVKLFGFPVVAVGYFLLLYIQCTVAVRFVCKRTIMSNLQTGLRLGLSFALIYLIAMQEVFVEGSPFSTYGFEFIKYQFFMGLGDAIPALILCIIVAGFTVKSNNINGLTRKLNKMESITTIGIISVSFLVERSIGYETGIVDSSCNTYTVPCYLWTVFFGIAMGYIYTILYPALYSKQYHNFIPIRLTLIIGLNWIIFNSFIGMIMKDAMPQMLLKSGIDVIVFFIDCCIIGRFILNKDGKIGLDREGSSYRNKS